MRRGRREERRERERERERGETTDRQLDEGGLIRPTRVNWF